MEAGGQPLAEQKGLLDGPAPATGDAKPRAVSPLDVTLQNAGPEPGSPVRPGTLHSAALKQDENHYAEHYVLEHVLDHVEEMFATDGSLSMGGGADSEKLANERKQIFRQLQEITEAMDDKHVMVDLPVTNIDSIEDITLHMLDRLESVGILGKTQQQNAFRSVYKPDHMKPAMAHRLAVPVIYCDMRAEDGTIPDTICAFARLHHGTHVGEHDGEGIRFVFLLLEHEIPPKPGEVATPKSFSRRSDKSQAHVSAAEAITFILHDQESMDHLLLAKNAKDVHDAMQQYMESHTAWEKGAKVQQEVRLSQNEIGLTWEPENLPFGGIKRDAARRTSYHQDPV